MGPYGIIWDHMATYGTIWGHMGPYGAIWGQMCSCCSRRHVLLLHQETCALVAPADMCSWQRNHGRGIMGEEPWERNDGRGIMGEESWEKSHGGGITEEESWKRHHERGIMETRSPTRHPRGTQGAPREHPGGTLEAPRRHPGAPQGHPRDSGSSKSLLRQKCIETIELFIVFGNGYLFRLSFGGVGVTKYVRGHQIHANAQPVQRPATLHPLLRQPARTPTV